MGKKYLSDMVYWTVDCASYKYKYGSLTEYSKGMGQGDVVYSSENEHEWTRANPNSVSEALLDEMC
jgi:hypothetical protein